MKKPATNKLNRSFYFVVLITIIIVALGWRYFTAKNQKSESDKLHSRLQNAVSDQSRLGVIVCGMLTNDPAKVAVAERELTPENLKKWKSSTDWAIMQAVREGNTQALTWMLKRGWMPKNSVTRQEAFSTAQRFCYTDIVSLLIDYGMDPDGNHNHTPLMTAAARPDLEMAKMLLAHGAHLEIASKPMPPASMGGVIASLDPPRAQKEMQRIPKRPYKPGPETVGTALMLAARYGNPAMVEFLLQNGADPTAKNVYGETALNLAQKYEYPEIVKRLETAELVWKKSHAARQ